MSSSVAHFIIRRTPATTIAHHKLHGGKCIGSGGATSSWNARFVRFVKRDMLLQRRLQHRHHLSPMTIKNQTTTTFHKEIIKCVVWEKKTSNLIQNYVSLKRNWRPWLSFPLLDITILNIEVIGFTEKIKCGMNWIYTGYAWKDIHVWGTNVCN